ncbi:peroxidase [Parasedimentitalea maritima]|uniref:Peroxidase n=1 Tax=Parasedimentitalea maritima TaxID=2578117 RepID=A0ABY2USD1_9RHOB|nr:hexameric tyrosine-coordinated heme protein [Zongyanglinia marina]TLP60316.1 peroxidase [Zongyanglinia marina]
MPKLWLTSLEVSTPQEGYELAVLMARVAVKMTQPSDDIRRKLRTVYEQDADALIASSSVVATHFATVAAANNYWKESQC